MTATIIENKNYLMLIWFLIHLYFTVSGKNTESPFLSFLLISCLTDTREKAVVIRQYTPPLCLYCHIENAYCQVVGEQNKSILLAHFYFPHSAICGCVSVSFF